MPLNRYEWRPGKTNHKPGFSCAAVDNELASLRSENERLRATLKEIEVLDYWGGDRRSNEIAREAIEGKGGNESHGESK